MTAPVTATDRTSEGPEPEGPFAMSPVELLRWAWRQLTSMRTALLLLLLVALGSVPGSVIPQSNIAPGDVAEFKELHPTSETISSR
jgi:cytochrome c biogenesis protein